MGIPEEGGLLFSGGSVVKESTCQFRGCRKHRFDPGAGKILWRRKWQPTSVLTEQPGRLQTTGSKGWMQLSTHTGEERKKGAESLFKEKRAETWGSNWIYTSIKPREHLVTSMHKDLLQDKSY